MKREGEEKEKVMCFQRLVTKNWGKLEERRDRERKEDGREGMSCKFYQALWKGGKKKGVREERRGEGVKRVKMG